MSRATEDVSRVRMYLGPALMYRINLFFLITFVLISMVQIDPVLNCLGPYSSTLFVPVYILCK